MSRVVAGLVALALLAGCGSPDGPVEVPAEELPFAIARSPTPTETPRPDAVVRVFLTRRGRLVAAPREVAVDGPLVDAALRALLAGPTDGERSRGISTRLPTAVEPLRATLTGGIAHVDLSQEFHQPAQPDAVVLRVGQVVWTLTDLPGVRAVRFSIEGTAVAVTTGRAQAVEGPVARSDFATVAPRG